ncbi:MAG: GTPase HflX [Deltaproteobacteria bacterium]|nr:GTPase HflX [Deltaproteobacteria bacterium]
MHTVHGNTHGLKPSQTRALEKLYARRVDPAQLVSPELARTVTELVHELRRPLGLLIDRGGRVEAVVLGTEQRRIYLPDIGRARAGLARLRGVRLVAAFPGGPIAQLPRDLLTDLQKLQLDAVAALGVDPAGLPGTLAWAQLLPRSDPSGERYRLHEEPSVHGLRLDFQEFVRALEDELTRETVDAREARSGAVRQDRAVLVGVYDTVRGEAEASMMELRELARSAGVTVVDVVMQFRRLVDPRTVLGRGKLEEVVLGALQHGADIIVFDRDLSPSQLNAITQETELKVLDRTMLILDIFAQRARTTDGKLQVELAQLKYSLPRLAQRQTGMSRLTGGIGGRGPGETRLEIDRRRAKDRVNRLEKQLEKVASQRTLRRSARRKEGLPVISIVGYTNAGKSTLLNALTQSDVFVANQLFATLDPVSRRLRFPHEREVIITDTVGFIRDLPADLVNAFKATLEELSEADLLLHVFDGADPDHDRHIKAVERVLEQLGVQERPRILVMNKVDQLEADVVTRQAAALGAVPVSALTRDGIPALLNAAAARLWTGQRTDEPVWEQVASPAAVVPAQPPGPPSHDELRRTWLEPPRPPAETPTRN